MNPTPTISEVARRAAQEICDNWFATEFEREDCVNNAAAIIQSALDSAHPAPKEGHAELKEFWLRSIPDGLSPSGRDQVATQIATLQLDLSEAKRERDDLRKDLNRIAEGCGVGCPDREEAIKRIIALRSQLKTANELLTRAQAHMDKHHQRAALCDDIDTHLNQQSK